MKNIILSAFLATSALIAGAHATGTTGPITGTSATTTVSNQPVTKADVEGIVASYIKDHPEVVMESIQAAMAKEQEAVVEKMKQAVASNKDKIYGDKTDPTGGNTTASVTLVAFMDPYCGHCKHFHTELNKYLSENKDLKVIFKDIPIMGDPSKLAVKAMFAAQNQGKYQEMQNAIFLSDKHLNKKQIAKIAEKIGLKMDQFEKDMKSKELDARLDGSMSLATNIGVNGTPTLILGDEVIPGFIPGDVLKEKVTALSKKS